MGFGGGKKTQIEKPKAVAPPIARKPSVTEYEHPAPVEREGLTQVVEQRKKKDKQVNSLRTVGSGIIIPKKQKAGVQS